MPRSLRKHTQHLDRRLRLRLYLYALISLILIAILIFNVVRGALRLDLGLLGMIAGIAVGIITSRMYHTSWNKDARKVVSKLDVFGIGILVFYVGFELLRERIVGFFTHDFEVGTIGLAVLAGIMFGRVLGTRGKIMKILKEQKILG